MIVNWEMRKGQHRRAWTKEAANFFAATDKEGNAIRPGLAMCSAIDYLERKSK